MHPATSPTFAHKYLLSKRLLCSLTDLAAAPAKAAEGHHEPPHDADPDDSVDQGGRWTDARVIAQSVSISIPGVLVKYLDHLQFVNHTVYFRCEGGHVPHACGGNISSKHFKAIGYRLSRKACVAYATHSILPMTGRWLIATQDSSLFRVSGFSSQSSSSNS